MSWAPVISDQKPRKVEKRDQFPHCFGISRQVDTILILYMARDVFSEAPVTRHPDHADSKASPQKVLSNNTEIFYRPGPDGEQPWKMS